MRLTGRIKRALSLFMAAGLISLAGCSDAAMGTDSLLRPPRATGDKAAIQDIISSEAGGSYNLKYPQKGENRSAITMRNEDTDNEYVLALYSTENDTKLNVSVIVYDKKQWKCLGTYSNNASGVDRVMFYDINGDKKEEILIGWTSYNTTQKSLTAYLMDTDEVYEMSIDETYDELVVFDITDDQSDDIILLSLSTQEKPSVATLLQYSDTDKRPVGKYSLELDSDVISFSNILVGDVAVNTNAEVMNTSSAARAEPVKTSAASGDEGKTSDPSKPAENSEPAVASSKPAENSEPAETSSKPPENSEPAEASSKPPENSEPAEASSKPAENSKSSESSRTESGPPQQSSKESSEEQTSSSDGSKVLVTGSLNKKGIILDCKRNDNTFCTQMIYYDNLNDELTDPLDRTPETGAYTNPTIRTEAIFSRDIDNDGVIEVPAVSQMNASLDENGANVCNLTSWSSFNACENKMSIVKNTVMNLKDGYYFVMPERWVGRVTARSDPETRETSFYLWNSKTASPGDKLLTIFRFNEQQWNENKHAGLILLEISPENSKAIYAGQLFMTNAEDELNLSEKELKSSVFAI